MHLWPLDEFKVFELELAKTTSFSRSRIRNLCNFQFQTLCQSLNHFFFPIGFIFFCVILFHLFECFIFTLVSLDFSYFCVSSAIGFYVYWRIHETIYLQTNNDDLKFVWKRVRLAGSSLFFENYAELTQTKIKQQQLLNANKN